jgi:23S rRNA (cytidine1920-2'-O)/16S rRNA (cytidine1409-2'-O)-methyltransferase
MASSSQRLDAELVRRGIARSREQAAMLIRDGRVSVNKRLATKPAMQVTSDADLAVRSDPSDKAYASRGGYKLQGALDSFIPLGLVVNGKRALDAGASTGGFTDVLLRNGVSEVVAVDVGHGQLVERLRLDDRVQVFDRTNVRDLSSKMIGGDVDIVVGDLSFISLRLVLDHLIAVATSDADLILMVKPQFEVGREKLGKGGVVREPQLRLEAVLELLGQARDRGWGCKGVCASPLPGPSGNVEYFVWLHPGNDRVSDDVVEKVVLTSSSAEQKNG